MSNQYVITPDIENVQHNNTVNTGLLQTDIEHQGFDMSSARDTSSGTYDKFSDIRLRIGIIDNFELHRPADSTIDPLDNNKIINMHNANIVIKWIDLPKGIIRPDRFAYPYKEWPVKWEYLPDVDKKNIGGLKQPEKYKLNCYTHDQASAREMVPLTHSFIWSNYKLDNWCGINYLPPIGSIVVIGFRKQGLPVMLGYLNSSYKTCTPYLRLGEIMIKGYGKNYAHFRWSNKFDLHVESKKGEIDLDDPYKKQTYPHSTKFWIRLDAWQENILISAENELRLSTKLEVKPEHAYITCSNGKTSESTKSILTFNSMDIVSTNTEHKKSSNFHLDTGSAEIGATNNGNTSKFNISGKGINFNSNGNGFSISDNGIKFNSTGGSSFNISDKGINLDSNNGNFNISDKGINLNSDNGNFNISNSGMKFNSDGSSFNISDNGINLNSNDGNFDISNNGINLNCNNGNFNISNNGINLNSNDGNVNISNNGINLNSNDGNVNISNNGINLNSNDGVSINGTKVNTSKIS